MRLHHDQAACPPGAEIHVGVADPFAPARKAHGNRAEVLAQES